MSFPHGLLIRQVCLAGAMCLAPSMGCGTADNGSCEARLDQASCQADGGESDCVWAEFDVAKHLGHSCERTPRAACVTSVYYGDGCGGGPPDACPAVSSLGDYYRVVGEDVWLEPVSGSFCGSTPQGWTLCGTGPADPPECECVCLEQDPGSGSGGGSSGSGS